MVVTTRLVADLEAGQVAGDGVGLCGDGGISGGLDDLASGLGQEGDVSGELVQAVEGQAVVKIHTMTHITLLQRTTLHSGLAHGYRFFGGISQKTPFST